MKKLIFLVLLVYPSLAFADRFGGIPSNGSVALSTQTILLQNTLQSGATFFVSSGTVAGTMTAGTFSGSGASLTGIPSASLTGTVANSAIDSSSVTKQGNTFNGNSQLLQLSSTGLIPNAKIDSSSVTAQGNNFNSASQLLKLDSLAGFSVTAATVTTISGSNIQAQGLNVISISSTGVAIQGSNTNDTARAGTYGEVISSATSAAASLTSATYNVVLSITLTSGDWSVSGAISFQAGGASFSRVDLEGAISTGSGNNTTGATEGSTYLIIDHTSGDTAWNQYPMTFPPTEKKINTTTTYYLKAYPGSFTGGPAKCMASLSAVRIR